MNRWLNILLIILIAASAVSAQQHALYSQYIFNLYVINPAYAGFRDALSANAGYRAQWVGLEGAPVTQHFTAHTPIKPANMSVGLIFQNDEIGARMAPSLSFTYGYAVNINSDSKLRFGIQAGVINYQMNWSQLNYNSRNEPVNMSFDGNRWIPTMDFGVLYTAPKSYAGLSILGLNDAPIDFTVASDAKLTKSINLMAGKIFELNEFFSIKPGGLLRYSEGVEVQFDVSLGVLMANKVWLTGIYRDDFGVVTAIHCFATERLHFGYSFDWTTSSLASYQNGTHEVFIGYDFNIYRSENKARIFY